MKNLKIKNIALGLFLAGYAASSAFAVDEISASSVKSILGNAPLVNAAGKDSTTTNSVDIAVTRNGAAVSEGIKTGDTVKLSWKIADADGDTDIAGAGSLTAKSVQFGYKKDGQTVWLKGSETVGSDGSVTWVIPADAKGATAIYYMVRAQTEFGLPAVGGWLAGDISKSEGGAVEVIPGVDPSDPSKPTTPPTTGTDVPNGGGGTGGGTVAPPIDETTGIEPNADLFVVNIYKAGETTSYSAEGATVSPKLGESYEAKVTDATDATKDHTADFSFTWFLTGGNAAANGKVAADQDIGLKSTDAAKGTTVAIAATNKGLAIVDGATIPEAGAQGFKLKVIAK